MIHPRKKSISPALSRLPLLALPGLFLCSCATRQPSADSTGAPKAVISPGSAPAPSAIDSSSPPSRRSSRPSPSSPPPTTSTPSFTPPASRKPPPPPSSSGDPSKYVLRGNLKSREADGLTFAKRDATRQASSLYQEASALSRARSAFLKDSRASGRAAPDVRAVRGVFVLTMPSGSTPRQSAAAVDTLLAQPDITEVKLLTRSNQ